MITAFLMISIGKGDAEMNQPLFERLGRQVTLTEAGRRLRPYAAQILALTQEATAVTQATECYNGTLRIGAAESLCIHRLPAVFRQYRTSCPQVQIHIETGSCQGLRDALRTDRVELIVVLDAPRALARRFALAHGGRMHLSGAVRPPIGSGGGAAWDDHVV
jgi:DNA-binding transcriptional LysR family regulator